MIPQTLDMGPQNQNEGFIHPQILQNIQLNSTGTNQAGQISKGNFGKRLHHTFSISHGSTLLCPGESTWIWADSEWNPGRMVGMVGIW